MKRWIITGLLLASLAGVAAAGKIVLLLDDTTWDFTTVVSRIKGKIAGLGKAKILSFVSAELQLLPGDTWRMSLDGEELATGTYTRKNECSRKLRLELDAPSVDAVLLEYEGDIEAILLSELGIAVNLNLTAIDKQVIRTGIKLKKKQGTMAAKASVRFKFSGTADGAPAKVAARLKGLSDTQPFGGTFAADG